jgi:putative N-acetylmannosamine-6-phosphate epimerase
MDVKTRMRIAAALIVLTLVATLTPTTARADQCDTMTCEELCKADKKACSALRTTLSGWLKAFCKSDADDQEFDCIDAKTDADENCALLCGDEFKQCMSANKEALKVCLADIQTGIVSCRNDMRAELSDASDGCKADFADCNAACGGV